MRDNTAALLADGGAEHERDGAHPLSEGIGDRLSMACAGVPLSDLAELTGLTPETIREQLRQGRPTPDFIAAVCVALELSADWILCGRADAYEER